MTAPPIPPSDLPDETLVERARTGDREAFDRLVLRYLGAARAYVAKMIGDADAAEDVCQDAFVKAWRALPGFRAESKFRTWLWRILINTARDVRRPRLAPIDDVDPPAVAERDMAAEEAVAAAIAQLPERQRQVLLMKAELDLSPTEIAEALGISYENVKANLCLARKKLRELLK